MSKKRRPSVKEARDYVEPLFVHKYQHLLLIGLILVLLSIFFFRMAYQGFVPKAGDTMQWRAAAEVQLRYNEENPDLALWNSNLFAGMPGYLISYPARYPFVKNIFDFLARYLINWRVLYMFIAGVGMYILLLSLGFKPMYAFISGMAFALSCHFIGLIEIGHDTKYRAITYIPLILWGVHYLFTKRNLLGMGLTAMFIIQQLRENHVQITYYTFIMLLIYWCFSFFWHKKDFKLKEFFIATGLFLLTLVIIGMAVAQPYLSVREYSAHTIRGGDSGLSTDYATSWSFHPLEMLTFLVPEFFGGIAPFYWGWMPFTQTYMYMGIIIFVLALLAIFSWKERMVKFLAAVSLVSLFFSFGRHFPPLSNFLLNYLPFYNKFRVPAMILMLLQFSVAVMACYGLKLITDMHHQQREKFIELIKKLFIASILLLILFFGMAYGGVWESILSFEHASDGARYDSSQLEYLRTLRFERFQNSGLISLGLLSGFFLLTFLLLRKKGVTPYLYLILVAGLIITDLMLINRNHFDNLVKEETIEQEFRTTEADKFLLEDEEVFRIYPIGAEFGQSRWAFYHQTIGGYHGAKLRRYQDILDYSLNAELRYREPINWNIVNMLNVKYLVSPFQLPFDNIEYSFYDRERRVTLYKNQEYLPRAWFVEETELVSKPEQIFRHLNSIEFDPAKRAIIESPISIIEAPEESSVDLLNYGLHDISFQVSTDKNSLLTVSEIYYPVGWNAYLNGDNIEIIPVNYILRGVVIPPGEHLLEMRFEPETHKISIILSLIGVILTVIFVIIGVYLYFKENFRGEIVYVVKSE